MSQGKKYKQTTLNFSQPDSSSSSFETSEAKRRRLTENSGVPSSVGTMAGRGRGGRGGTYKSSGKGKQRNDANTGSGRGRGGDQGNSRGGPHGPSLSGGERKLTDRQVERKAEFSVGAASSASSERDEQPSSPNSSSANTKLSGSQDLFDGDSPAGKGIHTDSEHGRNKDPHPSEVDLPSDDDDPEDDGMQSVPGKLESMWRGAHIDDLRTAPSCYKDQENRLRPDKRTKILFQVPEKGWKPEKPLEPYPKKYSEEGKYAKPDEFVSMPCSPENLFPNPSKQGEIQSRWEVIQVALSTEMACSFDLEEVILLYNSHYRKKWDFQNLHNFFSQVTDEERVGFFAELLPRMAELALRLPEICTKPIPILRQDEDMKLVMSQEQAACLLANAFFCTFPRRNVKMRGNRLPDINFSTLFNGQPTSRRTEKLKCIFNYFRRVTKDMPTGVVSYHRQVLDITPDWSKEKKQFTDLHVTAGGTIEDDGKGMLQADFANKFVGGGVLGRGCVQEEIRFLICPEMILSRLFTEVLTDKEVLIMTGCERFSKYSGYADTFMFEGEYEDVTEKDSWGRFYTEVVAMDAIVVRNHKDQFQQDRVQRELNKAYCAFKGAEYKTKLSAVATGNWGCGAFGGDKHLKALIQLIAASCAGREVCFFTFGDEDLCLQLEHTHSVLTNAGCNTGTVLKLIQDYRHRELSYGRPRKSLLEFVCTELDLGWISPPSPSSNYGSLDFNSQDWKANTP